MHLLPRGLCDRFRVLHGESAVGHEPGTEPRHRVAALCGLVLLDVAEDVNRLVLGVVQGHAGRRDDVAVGAEAEDERLHERRPLTGARAVDGRVHRLVFFF